MIQTYHHGRFEFFVAVIVIAIIATAAFGRYAFMAKDAQVLRLEIISHHFMTGMANIRVQLLLENITNKNTALDEHVEFAGQQVYFSPQGWPVSVSEAVADGYRPTDEDCYHLWNLVLQNPAPIPKGATAQSNGEYRVLVRGEACRYQFEEGDAYFDYFPMNGRLIFESVVN